MKNRKNPKRAISPKADNTQALTTWLNSLPEVDQEDCAVTLTLRMDLHAWITYARAAKVRGETLEETLATILGEDDCEFQARQFKTIHEEMEEFRRNEAAAKGGAK